jgi:hypothetical protein
MPTSEALMGLRRLVDHVADDSIPAIARLQAAVGARSYFEALTRNIVAEAREEGASWFEVAEVFGTTEQNVQARFGDLRKYDDE